MNDGINNHNSATVCYIIATVIIVWLAAGFLRLSYHQLAATDSLRQNLVTEQSIIDTIRSLNYEREAFDRMLNTEGMPDSEDYTSLKNSRVQTETTMDQLEIQLAAMSGDSDYTEQIMFDELSLASAVSRLKTLRSQLQSFTLFAHDQLDKENINKRIGYISANLFNRYTNLINHLIAVGSGTQFLYSKSGASVGPHKAMLRLVWSLEENTSYTTALINRAITKRQPLNASAKNILNNKKRAIEKDWKLIDLHVLSKGVTPSLHQTLERTRKLYNGKFFKARSAVTINRQAASIDAPRLEAWQQAISELKNLRTLFISSIYSELERNIKTDARKASSMLMLNSLLIAIALGIILFAIGQHRKYRHLALHDTLTGLPNSTHLDSKLKSSVLSQNQNCALIFIDLDRFKAINDRFGHQIGDELLVAVAERLTAQSETSDFIARLRGDEFVIFQDDVASSESVMKFATNVVSSLSEHFNLSGGKVTVGASAGVSLCPADCSTAAELLTHADIALLHGKDNKSAPIQQYNHQMGLRYHTQLQTEQDLSQALNNDEFELYYQPKVDSATGMVSGVEALIRWNHPEKGQIPPFEFIPVAEETGLMTQIGKWALCTACHQIAEFNKQAERELSVAVNISAQQFSEGNFLRHVTTALSKSGLSVNCLELEITESIVLIDIEAVIDELEALREIGVSIAIDDFGTGYSSLQYLQRLPLNTLKIDRSFIMAMDSVDPKKSVANSIVQMGKLFNLATVAEGVETQKQKNKIHSLGVDLIQGYLYSRPVPMGELGNTIVEIERGAGEVAELRKTA